MISAPILHPWDDAYARQGKGNAKDTEKRASAYRAKAIARYIQPLTFTHLCVWWGHFESHISECLQSTKIKLRSDGCAQILHRQVSAQSKVGQNMIWGIVG